LDLPFHEAAPPAKNETGQILRTGRVGIRIDWLLRFARITTRLILAAPLRNYCGANFEMKLQTIDSIPKPKRLMAAGGR
jgi:hypothetical protein